MKNKTIASLSLRKLLLSVLVTAPLATLPVPLWALPATQTALNSTISSTSTGVTVTSNSSTSATVASTAQYGIVRWIDFGGGAMTINNGDTVTYNMPSSSSAVLNTVTGSNPTTINGTLTVGANGGGIWVQNPNGITVGATGVINATNIGLSTVPESEFYFSNNGKLQFVENTANGSGPIVTTNGVTLASGATLTAASGTGNVWIAGKGITAAGVIDAGNVTLSGFQGGTIALASGGDLTIGDVSNKTSTLTVNQTTSGAITVDAANNLIVMGPWASLSSGNGTISTLNTASAGVFSIGAGSPNNATLTTSSGTGDTTLTAVQATGTGTLNVTSTGANITVKSPGKLQVAATGTSLTAQAAGNLTVNAGNVSGAFSATSTGGDVITGGTMVVGGGATLSASAAGHNITAHFASAPTSLAITTNATGNVSITEDAGSLTAPAITANNIWLSSGNITTGGALAATGTLQLTASAGNVSIGHALSSSGGNVTIWASNSVLATAGSVNAAGAVAITGNTGNVDTTNLPIGQTTAPVTVSITAGKAVTLASAVTGNATTVTAGTTLTQSGVLDSVGTGGSMTLTAGGDLTSTNSVGNFFPAKTVSLTSTSGNISLSGNVFSLGGGIAATAGAKFTNTASLIATGGNVTVAANGGTLNTGAINANTITLSSSKALTIDNTQTIGTSLSATAATGDVTLSNAGAAAISAAGKNVSLTATTGNVAINNTISAGNVNVSAGGKVDITGALTIGTATTVAATGNVNITAGITSPALTITGAYINESGGGAITSTGATTLDSSSSIALPGTNALNKLVVKNAPSDASITESDGLTLASGTNTTGNLTIGSGGAIVLGAAAGDTITVAKALTLTAAGSITDLNDNNNVGGNLVLSATGAITLDGSAGTGIGLNSSYGAVKVSATGGAVTLFENTTLNLGTLNLAGNNLMAYSVNGNIVNSGVITQTAGTIKVGAGSAAAPGTINLDFNDTSSGGAGPNLIQGKITILTNNDVHGITGGGSFLASSIKVVNGASAATLFELVPNIDTPNPSVNVDLATVGSAALNVGQLGTSGTVNLTSATGAITATNAQNTFTAVNVKSGGAVNVSSSTALTVNGNITGTGTVAFGAGNATTAGALTIGSYVSGTTGSTTFTSTGGAVTDSVTNIGIYGPVSFVGKSVSVTKSGHSFGPVSIDTSASNGAAAVSEATTLNLATINTGTGAFTASSNGGILQTGSLTAGNVTVSAPQGTVTLNNAGNNFGGWISLTASGNSAIVNTGNITLGGTTVTSGTLSVDASANNKAIMQASGATIYTYGATTFNAGTGTINVANSGNQFGGLTLGAAGAGDITVKEMTTLNLKKVTTAGKLTATSEGGSIVDSQAADGDIAVTGATTLTADNGSISIATKKAAITSATLHSTNGSVTLRTNGSLTATTTAGGNATLSPTGTLTFGATTVGGDLTAGVGTTGITQTGAINASGNVTLWSSGTITLNDATNQFGPVQLHNTGIAAITEAGTFNLRAGSVAQGQVIITTGGNFITSGTGGSSFTGGANTNATTAGLIIHAPNGTITFGAGSVVVTNGLTVDASGTKDLSQLSKSGNLNGNDPFNQGTGTLIPPSTP